MSIRTPRYLAGVVIAAAFGLGACAETGMMKKVKKDDMMSEDKMSDDMMSEQSLYDRLGGQDAIVAVVDAFTVRVATDFRINHRFANTDVAAFKALLVEQICEATGGPCTYSGRDMKTSHAGMNISDEEFAWTGEHLAKALDKLNVPEQEKNELLSAIGSMQGDIVGQ